MNRNHPVSLPLTAEYQGGVFQIKALKCTSFNGEILYKIALPSSLCSVPICWISGSGTDWELILGVLPNEDLKDALIAAILKLEDVPKLIPRKTLPTRISA
jgi:hypothetical protein